MTLQVVRATASATLAAATTEDGKHEVKAAAGDTLLGCFVVEGQVRGVVCGAAAQADIQVQDLFLPSISETADEENWHDKDDRAQNWR